MSEISRALANRHYDRAFVLLRERWTEPIAAAFLIESGVDVDDLPIGALHVISRHKLGLDA